MDANDRTHELLEEIRDALELQRLAQARDGRTEGG